MVFSFKGSFEFRKCIQAWCLELADPTLRDAVDRNGVDEMQLFAAMAAHRNQVRLLQDGKMLCYRLAAHFHPLTQITQGLAISGVQPIEEQPPARIRQRPKHTVVIHHMNMQPYGYLSRGGSNAAN